MKKKPILSLKVLGIQRGEIPKELVIVRVKYV